MPDHTLRWWRVGGVGKRGQQIGWSLGYILENGEPGNKIALRFDDGQIELFGPHDLFPELSRWDNELGNLDTPSIVFPGSQLALEEVVCQ